jgi:integrase
MAPVLAITSLWQLPGASLQVLHRLPYQLNHVPVMTKLGNPWKVGDVKRYVLRPICKKLGIPLGGMHAFRHGRVSKMQDEGVNEKIILLEVGHSSLRMTRRYTHFSHEQRRATAERLAI